jgi:hypothetical protein
VTRPIPQAIVVLVPYGLVFFGSAWALRIPEASSALSAISQEAR